MTSGMLFTHHGDYPRSGASFSTDKKFRYELWREWREGRRCNFIMLNPSTADELLNDPTVERCQRRAFDWGYAGLVVTNLFALRSTDPAALLESEEPTGGGENDLAILRTAVNADMVVCAWGNHARILDQSSKVRRMLRDAGVTMHYLKLAKTGEPCHPLYLPYKLKPVIWEQEKGLFA